jgi:hypothetical protein
MRAVATSLRERGEAAVCRFDVEPQSFLTTQVGERAQRIDSAGVRGPRIGSDQQRL